MGLTRLGILLVLPSALSFALATPAGPCFGVQARLEEDFLERMHGNACREFKREVRRCL
jgi:protein-S-isoprenylcysteine O-methyltransferase Ste14